MRITFLGHVGMYVETRGGSVLCDPWFNPAYFGSWFPYPRNDDLPVESFASPDFLYVTHLHRDHFDPEFLREHVDKRARVLLPDFRVPYLEEELRALGFEHFIPTRAGAPVQLGGLTATIVPQDTPADGPLGDSLIVLDDGTARILNQNDSRPGDLAALQALGPFDAQFVQFSGAIWYPVAYELAPEVKAKLAAEKRTNQMERARKYIEWIDAAHVFPCAGPPAFLDPDLWHLNDFDDADDNIFPDQPFFLDRLKEQAIATGELVVPGSVIELDGGDCTVTHPAADATTAPFGANKRAYLERYRDDWAERLAAERAGWSTRDHDLVAELKEWIEPLLTQAPITSAGIAGNVVFEFTPDDGVVIDFVASEVRAWTGDAAVYHVRTDRRLLEACVERHLEDWVNALFLSCRFTAVRSGAFNEYVMTFFKALSPSRIAFVEGCYREARRAEEFIELDGYRIERWCPHRQADLGRFGSIEDGVLTCALHHWQFDLESGRCLTSDDRRLRCSLLDTDD